MFFRKNRKRPEDNVDIAGEEVSWSTQAEYLGVILDQGQTFKDHVDYLVEKTKKAIIKDIMLYAYTAWGDTAEGPRSHQTQQNISKQ